jgi:hypothetical protein
MEIHIKKWTNGKYAQQIVEIYKEMNVEILTQIK